MQLLVLILFAAIMVHDQYALIAPVPPSSNPWSVVPWLLGPALVAGAYHLACRHTARALIHQSDLIPLRRLEKFQKIFTPLLLGCYLFSLALGGLSYLRLSLGNPILLDELLFITPTLLAQLDGWYAYYPLDRRIRQAALLHRIDQGLSIHAIWSRPQYLLAQIRHQWLLMGAPLLLLYTWQEFLGQLGPEGRHWFSPTTQLLLTLVGSGSVLLFTPMLIRHLWDTIPLPASPLREDLLAMCGQYRVRVREILLWRTFGGVINAAVMGVIGPARYILLSDALLDRLSPLHIQAVMAHELAHIRKHHIPWLGIAALGLLSGFYLLLLAPLRLLLTFLDYHHLLDWIPRLVPYPITLDQLVELATSLPAIVLWGYALGWIMRRFERQADTFAVQHLTRSYAEADACVPHLPAHPQAVAAMVDALQSIADLNHISIHRPGWRHGSIAWRQAYLRSLTHQPIDQLPIDRTVTRIKIICLTLLVLTILVDYA